MAFAVIKPGRYATCISCKSAECLTEYQFGSDAIKSCIVLCCNCVANMYRESIRHEEETNDAK